MMVLQMKADFFSPFSVLFEQIKPLGTFGLQ